MLQQGDIARPGGRGPRAARGIARPAAGDARQSGRDLVGAERPATRTRRGAARAARRRRDAGLAGRPPGGYRVRDIGEIVHQVVQHLEIIAVVPDEAAVLELRAEKKKLTTSRSRRMYSLRSFFRRFIN